MASAVIVNEATGEIRTKSVLAEDESDEQVPLPVTQVNMLWSHYKTARSTLERMAEDTGKGALDVHSSYVDRAVRLLEVLVLRKEKGKVHFMNMTLGAPVIPNNPAFDPDGEGQRRAELPPTDDVPEMVKRTLAELEHAMRPNVRPGARAVDVSKTAKALQEAIEKARAAAPPKQVIPATEASSCCSSASSSSSSCSKPEAATGAGSTTIRHRHHAHGHHKKDLSHRHRAKGGCCGGEQEQANKSLVATVASLLAWAKAALSGPEGVKEHMHMPGGGCCGGGAAGPSRMGSKQDGHAFLVAVLALVILLPFVLWWMS